MDTFKTLFGAGCSAVFCIVLTGPSAYGASIPVGVQAAEWPGSPAPSSARSHAPVTFGVPIPDSAGIKCSGTGSPLPFTAGVTNLQLLQNGSPVGSQIRCMGLWPSGNAEWVLVDAQLPTFTEGTLDSSLSLSLGSSGGTTGAGMAIQCVGAGSPLAACPDANHILVNTGAATFLIKEANYNLFDQVSLGGSILVSASKHSVDDGLALLGPQPGLTGLDAVSCPNGPPLGVDATAQPCTNLYSSANDSASTCAIEDNGPLRSVVMCQGDLKDSGQHVYMHWRTRTTFWANHSDVKLDAALRNADLSTAGGDFASAYKELVSFDARVTVNLASGNRTVTFGGAGSDIQTGLSAGTSDNAYLYQGYSQRYNDGGMNIATCSSEGDRCAVPPLHRTGNSTYDQDGFEIVKNGGILASGNDSSFPQGWADESDTSGNGVEVGGYMFSAYWPGALEFFAGGDQARVALHPDQSLFISTSAVALSYAERWPAYTIRSLYFNFHAGALAQPADPFLTFQQRLLARLPGSAYDGATNAATGDRAMMLPLVDPVQDDSYYLSFGKISACSAGSCLKDIPDSGTLGGNGSVKMVAPMFRYWAGGSTNQLDEAWSFIRNFLTRGCSPSGGSCGPLSLTGSTPGRFMWGENFYHLVMEGSIPRSDFGGWRSVCSSPCPHILGKWGYPDAWNSLNGGMRQWEDEANGEDHLHTAGLVDYYFLTGNPWAYETLQQGYKDIALNQNIPYNNALTGYQNPGHEQFNANRAAGHWLEMHARESLFLCAILDPDCDTSSKPTALLGAENTVAYAIAAPQIASGYPIGWTNPSEATCLNNGISPCAGGTSPVRGYNGLGVDANDAASYVGPSGTPLQPPVDGKAHAAYETFMESIVEQGLFYFNIAERSVRGNNWSGSLTVAADGNQTNVPVTLGDLPERELTYAISNSALNESFVKAPDVLDSGWVYITFPGYLNSSPPCYPTSGGPNCTHVCAGNAGCGYGENYFHFFGIGSQSGSTVDLSGNSWQHWWEFYMKHTGSQDEWESAEQNAVTSLILSHNPASPTSYALDPNVVTLQKVPVSVSPNPCIGPANCTITWSTPSGLSPKSGNAYVLKYYSCATGGADCPSGGKQIVDWLSFHSNCLTGSSSTECTGGTGSLANNPCFGGMNAVDGSGCWEAGKTPDTHWNWFASTDSQTQPSATATSYTFTAQSGTTYTFALKAWKTGPPGPTDTFAPARPQGLALE